ncbi:MAG: YbaN family protein [Eubacteriales bacterium]|nr:YbaN family protein [Eubacteriales bacterium]
MKIIFVILGTISFVLGLIGIIVPILPTTPFILLTAFLYLHGSERLHQWLTSHPIFGVYISDYFQRGGIRKSAKISAMIFLWIGLGLSILLIDYRWLQIGLVLIGVAVSWHILVIKTIQGEVPDETPKHNKINK